MLLARTSPEAWSSIINTAILVLNITFTVPQGILVTCGRERFPKRPSVVIVGLFVIVMLWWIERRNKFQGQAIDWEALNANNDMK